MRKVQKILLGVFLGGVLLGGVGTGVAFLEYSSISYAGERKIAEGSIITDNLDYSIDTDKGIVILEPVWYDEGYRANLETDESVPEGIVRYQVTYNTKTVKPHLEFLNYEEPMDEEEDYMMDDSEDYDMDDATYDVTEEAMTDGETDAVEPSEPSEPDETSDADAGKEEQPVKIQGRLCMEKWYHDEFGIWMENKDQILSDLKHGKIASYQVDYITDIKILVHPATRPYVTQERN